MLPYIKFDDSLQKSKADNLFLSYHPSSGEFRPDSVGKEYAGQGGMIQRADGVDHAIVIKDPYKWMNENR